jgi:hypothetical protein
VLGQVEKSQQNRASAFQIWRITGKSFLGPRIVPELMGCPMFRRRDPINLRFFTERAQGHFLSPGRGAERSAQNHHDSLFVRIRTIRESRLTAFRKNRQLFLQLLASIGINDIVVQNKMGGGRGFGDGNQGRDSDQGRDGDQGKEMVVVAKGKLLRSRWPTRRRSARR